MSFLDLHIQPEIKTTEVNPIDTFFNPTLKESIRYDVAVGYFSSSWIRDAAEGIANLAINGGKSRWVISPNLSKEDWDLLKSIPQINYEKVFINEKIRTSLELLKQSLTVRTREILAWLIYDNILEFRIAIPINELNGIFHSKVGILEDQNGNKIAFSGSYNMTHKANTNWENLEIFCDWKSGEASRVKSKVETFSQIWNRNDSNLKIFDLSDSSLEDFISIVNYSERPYKVKTQAFNIPTKFLNSENNLRNHQEIAIKNWFSIGNGKGIFNMATGSGKTVTAISTIIRLKEKTKKQIGVVITVPYMHLAYQWAGIIKEFNFEPILCFGSKSKWIDIANDKIQSFNLLKDVDFIIICVNKTFIGSPFQNLIFKMSAKKNLFLIADEVHNLGGRKIKELLPDKFRLRLGLSATPKRHMDELGTSYIYDYFGDEVIQYTIEDAINDGTLCKYFYYPVLIKLTEEESTIYYDLSLQINRLLGSQSSIDFSYEGETSFLQNLLIKRARLLGTAENKLNKLKAILSKNTESKYNLIYCGDGKYEDEKQIDIVIKFIGKDLNITIGKFTAEADDQRRAQLLKEFEDGKLQAIAAIRCLDEGVDIPKTQNAYIIASSTNPRQFIQRRGRVLRNAIGKDFANIYDFVVVPDLEQLKSLNDSLFNIERNLLKKEILRINEFAEIAQNSGDALTRLREYKKKLNLLDT